MKRAGFSSHGAGFSSHGAGFSSHGAGFSSHNAGFSLMELLVTLVVMSVAILGALSFFDVTTRLAKTQVSLAEIQSSQRIVHQELARMIGMAGVGGLPDGVEPARANSVGVPNYGIFPKGLGLSLENNIAANTDYGTTQDPLLVVPGTDVLTLRGVFSTPIYYIEPQQAFTLDASGKIQIDLKSDIDLGVSQNLEPLREALLNKDNEAFIVYDRYNPGAYVVLEYIASDSTLGVTGNPTLTLGLSQDSGTTYGNEYGHLSLGTTLEDGSGGDQRDIPGTGIPIPMPRNIGAIGLLEEFRFFIRQSREIPDIATSPIKATLMRVRFFPGTDKIPPFPATDPENILELADGIIDLQIALAIDKAPTDSQILEDPVSPEDDEILFNSPDDNDGLGSPLTSDWANPDARLLFLRLSTVAMADRPDRDYPGANLTVIEDHDYYDISAPPSIFNSGSYVKLRKRLLQTVIQSRNLP